MVKIKSIKLENYCGYENCFFDFSTKSGVKNFAVFFGPNGIGKTTLLNAIIICSNPNLFKSIERGTERAKIQMRKLIHDEEYLPTVDMVSSKIKKPMKIEAVFITDKGESLVSLDNDGLISSDLPEYNSVSGYTFFADADHPNKTQKFMLSAEQADNFLSFATEVYGYECDLASPISTQGIRMYTDFVIKKGKVRVHYKQMSAGERKIATLVSDLCQPVNTNDKDIFLIDNIEMHVYWKRHARMIDKLIEIFPKKQIIATTHSSVVINHIKEESRYDLERYRPDYKLLEDTGIRRVAPVVKDWNPQSFSSVIERMSQKAK